MAEGLVSAINEHNPLAALGKVAEIMDFILKGSKFQMEKTESSELTALSKHYSSIIAETKHLHELLSSHFDSEEVLEVANKFIKKCEELTGNKQSKNSGTIVIKLNK